VSSTRTNTRDITIYRRREGNGAEFGPARETTWATGRGIKKEYFPVPPTDHYQDLRSADGADDDSGSGCISECHHHEVATAVRREIDQRFDKLVNRRTTLMLYKYISTRPTSLARRNFHAEPRSATTAAGCTRTPELWKAALPLFAGDGYAGFKQMGLHYIAGLLNYAAGAWRRSSRDDEQLQAAGTGYERR